MFLWQKCHATVNDFDILHDKRLTLKSPDNPIKFKPHCLTNMVGNHLCFFCTCLTGYYSNLSSRYAFNISDRWIFLSAVVYSGFDFLFERESKHILFFKLNGPSYNSTPVRLFFQTQLKMFTFGYRPLQINLTLPL